MDEFDLYKKAIESWGLDIQMAVLMEECGELIQACGKALRKSYWGEGVTGETLSHLIEEMVDVQIMIDQIKHGFIYPENEGAHILFNQFKIEKLRRVQRWLQEE